MTSKIEQILRELVIDVRQYIDDNEDELIKDGINQAISHALDEIKGLLPKAEDMVIDPMENEEGIRWMNTYKAEVLKLFGKGE